MTYARDLARFSGFVVELHEQSRCCDAAALVQWFARRLAELVGFDACWCGWSDIEGDRVELCATLTLNLPDDYLGFWEAMKTQDLLARDVIEGECVLAHYNRSGRRQTEGMAALADRYRLDRMGLATAQEQSNEPILFLSAYRSGRHATAFRQGELEFLRQGLIHLRWVIRNSLIGGPGAARLLVDRNGRVLCANEADRRLLHDWWPTAARAQTAVGRLLSGDPASVRDTSLIAASRPVGMGAIEVVVRAASAWDQLTGREREVAVRIAEGNTYKEIARSLALSPATVRNHTSAIYRKVGVGSRAGLAHALYAGAATPAAAAIPSP